MNEEKQLKAVELMIKNLQSMKNEGKMSLETHEAYTKAIDSMKELVKNIKQDFY